MLVEDDGNRESSLTNLYSLWFTNEFLPAQCNPGQTPSDRALLCLHLYSDSAVDNPTVQVWCHSEYQIEPLFVGVDSEGAQSNLLLLKLSFSWEILDKFGTVFHILLFRKTTLFSVNMCKLLIG